VSGGWCGCPRLLRPGWGEGPGSFFVRSSPVLGSISVADARLARTWGFRTAMGILPRGLESWAGSAEMKGSDAAVENRPQIRSSGMSSAQHAHPTKPEAPDETSRSPPRRRRAPPRLPALPDGRGRALRPAADGRGGAGGAAGGPYVCPKRAGPLRGHEARDGQAQQRRCVQGEAPVQRPPGQIAWAP